MGRGNGGNRGGRPKYGAMREESSGVRFRNLKEFSLALSRPEYDPRRSYYSESGGFVLTQIEHNTPDEKVNKELLAARHLADYGYRVYLDEERSYIEGQKAPDGRINRRIMDVKTINKIGRYTVKSSLSEASGQGAEVAVLMENTRGLSVRYIKDQIELYKAHRHKDSKLREVIYVRKDGRVGSIKI